jgi:hypothetical protein
VITAADVAVLCGGGDSKWISMCVRVLSGVQRMQVSLRSAKNDQHAKGQSWTFYKGEDEHGSIFIESMAAWACQANSVSTDPTGIQR